MPYPAELPRLLVDVRHEATHNDLPSLVLLELAGNQALQWLHSCYWRRQAECLSSCQLRIQDLLEVSVAACGVGSDRGAHVLKSVMLPPCRVIWSRKWRLARNSKPSARQQMEVIRRHWPVICRPAQHSAWYHLFRMWRLDRCSSADEPCARACASAFRGTSGDATVGGR